MAIREIPKSFVYTCDVCGVEHAQENANGHYTDSRPPHWVRLMFKRTAYDEHNMPCVDASVELLLCPEHAKMAQQGINSLKKASVS